ncbi:MAG: dihydroorotate dehydrogenase electron transfer subunit [Desulfonatronovibrio sp. MSAO_Bac4]|nr:MAG: dihydroorotate dehydrogenase electron transfer subunit [Desulfonatronovibrio sp. MSAO_Bac4]
MNHKIENKKQRCQSLKVQTITYSGTRDFVHVYLDPPIWDYVPGQFVMFRPGSWGNDPVWPRPFSICEKTDDALRLFIQVVGRGTKLISCLRPGEDVDIWGPLGNGFSLKNDESVLILAGGMGIAPFVGLCKTHKNPGNINLLFGHRAPLSSYPYDELPENMSKEAMQQKSMEDLNEFQLVLKQKIQDFASKGRILACGPSPFLRAIQKYCLEYKADAWLSLENKMACGVGACLGCVARTTDDEYVQTCTCGPVFSADKVFL